MPEWMNVWRINRNKHETPTVRRHCQSENESQELNITFSNNTKTHCLPHPTAEYIYEYEYIKFCMTHFLICCVMKNKNKELSVQYSVITLAFCCHVQYLLFLLVDCEEA